MSPIITYRGKVHASDPQPKSYTMFSSKKARKRHGFEAPELTTYPARVERPVEPPLLRKKARSRT